MSIFKSTETVKIMKTRKSLDVDVIQHCLVVKKYSMIPIVASINFKSNQISRIPKYITLPIDTWIPSCSEVSKKRMHYPSSFISNAFLLIATSSVIIILLQTAEAPIINVMYLHNHDRSLCCTPKSL